MQRHVPWSITTVRFRLARAIARSLPVGPCCAKPHTRANKLDTAQSICQFKSIKLIYYKNK